ncbi:MAG: type II secretion system protein N [Rhodoferax sp.]
MNSARASSAAPAGLWGWAWSGALTGLLVGVLSMAPARWLAALVRQASNQQLEMNDARGTLWQGSTQLVFSGGEGSRDAVKLPGMLQWQMQPGWGGLSVQLRADCCTVQPLQLRFEPLGWDGLRLRLDDSQSHWPAGLLSGLGTPWNTMQPQGQLSFTSRALVLEWSPSRLQLAGTLQMDAKDISSRLSTLQPMGSYRVSLIGGAATRLQLETLEGSLQLSGQGQWYGHTLRFEGEASAAADRIDALSNLLNIIGRREGARSIIKVG